MEKRENKWISRAKNKGRDGPTKKKENMNGLVGAKNRELGWPLKEKRENKWISRG